MAANVALPIAPLRTNSNVEPKYNLIKENQY